MPETFTRFYLTFLQPTPAGARPFGSATYTKVKLPRAGTHQDALEHYMETGSGLGSPPRENASRYVGRTVVVQPCATDWIVQGTARVFKINPVPQPPPYEIEEVGR